MTISNPAGLRSVITEFGSGGSPTNLRAYYKGGSYVTVANSGTNSIGTSADGLGLRAFAGVTKQSTQYYNTNFGSGYINPNAVTVPARTLVWDGKNWVTVYGTGSQTGTWLSGTANQIPTNAVVDSVRFVINGFNATASISYNTTLRWMTTPLWSSNGTTSALGWWDTGVISLAGLGLNNTDIVNHLRATTYTSNNFNYVYNWTNSSTSAITCYPLGTGYGAYTVYVAYHVG